MLGSFSEKSLNRFEEAVKESARGHGTVDAWLMESLFMTLHMHNVLLSSLPPRAMLAVLRVRLYSQCN